MSLQIPRALHVLETVLTDEQLLQSGILVRVERRVPRFNLTIAQLNGGRTSERGSVLPVGMWVLRLGLALRGGLAALGSRLAGRCCTTLAATLTMAGLAIL